MADLDAPELAYLGNRADDGFDLPRFTARHQYQPSFADVRPTVNTYPATSPYSSNPHASLQPPIPQSAVEPSTYSTLPPSMMSNHPAATAQHRHQSRLSQIVSDPVDTQGASLNRSTSLGGRLRGHHSNPSDDIERAYPPQQQEPLSNSQRQLASSFYPPALGFSAPNQSESSAHTQDYMSYGPRRSNTQMDPSTPIRAPTSTAKSSANDGSQPGALDSPQHGYQTQQYLPPPSSYADPYTVSLNTNGAQSPAQQVKTELSSPLGPYVQPPMTPTQSGHYNLPYKPDPSSSSDNMNLDPNSSRRSYLTSVRTGGSASTPNTPLSYPVRQSPQPMGQQYYPLQQQQPPQQQFEPPRRRIGLRRVREARDLKPQMNLQPQGRRADPSGNGAFLSVRSLTLLRIL
jgi:dual specificity protein kinase YAK1